MKYEYRLNTTDVWKVCNENHYYTCGDNEAYNEMFNIVRYKDMTPEVLEMVAQNIKDNSDTTDTTKDIMDLLASYIIILVKK